MGPSAERRHKRGAAIGNETRTLIATEAHSMLDVAFDEDSRRIRDERAAENYALVSRIALMVLKRAPT
jgi:predicted transposase YbfD/YdcC